MNRRSFMRWLGLAPAAASLAPIAMLAPEGIGTATSALVTRIASSEGLIATAGASIGTLTAIDANLGEVVSGQIEPDEGQWVTTTLSHPSFGEMSFRHPPIA